MIDIIIPAYNAHDYILDGLFSIAIQSYVDKIKVYIVDDCSDKNYDEEIKKLDNKLNITYLKTPQNMGPGFARQYGIDNSDSEYVVFLDADDIIYDAHSIQDMFLTIDDWGSDVLITNFLEEYCGQYYTHYNNNIWMHGKIYRRSFLLENNIRFNNSSKNEDTGFNSLVSLCANKIDYLDITTYVWKYNENSITRKNQNEFDFSGLEGFTNNICWAVKEGIDRGVEEEKISKILYETIVEMYYNYIKYNYDDNICKWSKELKELYLKYKDKISEEEKEKSIHSMIEKGINLATSQQILSNRISFDDYINKIE